MLAINRKSAYATTAGIGAVVLAATVVHLFHQNTLQQNADFLRQVRNDNVSWNGSYIGIFPDITDAWVARLKSNRSEWEPLLVEMLDDPTRFAAAHVALCALNDVPPQFSVGEWNGLHVDISSDDKTIYNPAEQVAIKKRWVALPASR